MKVEWKTCFRLGASAFLLFLAIYYWNRLVGGLSLLIGAASPLIIGAVIAYLVNIPMSFYERNFFPRSKATVIVKSRRVICMLSALLTVLGVIALVIGLVIPELVRSIETIISWIPDAINNVIGFVTDSESLAEIIPQEYLAYLETLETINWEEWVDKIVQFLSSGIGGAVDTAVGAITSVFSGVVNLFLGLIFALYLLLGKDRLREQGNRLMKNYLPDVWRERISYVLAVINDCFHRYVVGQCTEAVILGILCMIGMWIFRFPYATMVGTLVGFTALIPVAGAYIGAIVGAFLILMVSPIKALLFIVFLSVLQQLEGNLIYPRVVGSSMGLPGMWVLVAVTIGGGLYGIPGMLIGVPLMASVYKLIRDDVHQKEGKERVALNRKRRERREKRRRKDGQEEHDSKIGRGLKVEANAAIEMNQGQGSMPGTKSGSKRKHKAKHEDSPKQESRAKHEDGPKQESRAKHEDGPKQESGAKHEEGSKQESKPGNEQGRKQEHRARQENPSKQEVKQKPSPKQEAPSKTETAEVIGDDGTDGRPSGNHHSRRRRRRHKNTNQANKESQ